MEISRYLAMTQAETERYPLPEGFRAAWMACHFSPYGTGLSNLPRHLPAGSLLTVNDRTPIFGHDPERIAKELNETVEALGCCGVLMDLQRPGEVRSRELCRHLSQALTCPLGVSEAYAPEIQGPVFLSPCPPDRPLKDHLSPWQGRELWLDTAPEILSLVLTEAGCEVLSLPWEPVPEDAHTDSSLHCRYRIQTETDRVLFTLWRDGPGLDAHLREAEALGVTKALGLLQEWKRILFPPQEREPGVPMSFS